MYAPMEQTLQVPDIAYFIGIGTEGAGEILVRLVSGEVVDLRVSFLSLLTTS